MREYIARAIEGEIKSAAQEFPVIILTGPRQTGKSTLLQTLFPKHEYMTLDDPLTRQTAQDDPRFFLSRFEHMIIDEIQHLPELLPYIKVAVDKKRGEHGRYLLTGSQCFPLMAGVSESLAGRTALYELLGLSSEEISTANSNHPDSCFKALFNGFFPEVVIHGAERKRFYSAYLQTYLERDIRQLASVHDLKVFQNFLELLATRAGGLLNLNEISKEGGISFTSARRWLSILEATRIIYLLRPYTKNTTKRIIKSPKIYFTDTGLLAFLLRYPDSVTLQAGPQGGSLFENLVIIELLKYKWNHNLNYELYFYRDSHHNEIDVVIDHGSSVNFIEIKLTKTPRMEHFSTLKKITSDFKKSSGYLVSFTQSKEKISDNIESIRWIDFLQTAKQKV